jgi:hypothetical protein
MLALCGLLLSLPPLLCAINGGGGHAVALGGGVGRQFKIAALGSGGGRRTCINDIGVSVVKAKGFLLRRWCQHWQGLQERTCTMRGTYINSADAKMVSARQEQGDDGMVPDRHR